jgi:histidyl-tRNA synthetase
MEPIHAVKGTYDILPGEVETWRMVEDAIRTWTARFGCGEIRVPVFEETRLFSRTIGDDTDIVRKEMYTFSDMGGRSVTLRPEGTASVIRAFIEHSLDQNGLPQSLWYMGPMFRQERPQKGRQRQFHQFGVESVGSRHVTADVDLILLFDHIAEDLGLHDRELSVNYVGNAESRSRYTIRLVGFLETVEEQLCDDCRRRMRTNPLRVLDCKVPGCRAAVHENEGFPKITDSLTDEDRNAYSEITGLLREQEIAVREDPFLVRGLDYYTGIVFEMSREGLGAQSAVMGGGRYDSLIGELGGPDLPAVGFACGMERLILAMQAAGAEMKRPDVPCVYLIPSEHREYREVLRYTERLRRRGFTSLFDTLQRSVKAQMRAASKAGSRYVLFVGGDAGIVEVRDMGRSTQETMTFEAFEALLDRECRSA